MVYQTYIFTHLPMVIGIAATAAGSRVLLQHAGGTQSPRGAAWILCGGLAVFLLSIASVRLVAHRSLRDRLTLGRIIASGVAILLAAIGSGRPPLPPMALLDLLVVVEIVSEFVLSPGRVSPSVQDGSEALAVPA